MSFFVVVFMFDKQTDSYVIYGTQCCKNMIFMREWFEI